MDCDESMNITLIFPPHWTPTMPHLALPWLTSLLRQNGHSVTQRDLNIEVFDVILTQRHLRKSVQRIRRRFGADGRLGAPGLIPTSRPQPDQVQRALKHGPALAEKVEKAKSVLRSAQFYDGEASLPAFLTIAEAMELNSLAHYPAHLDLSGFSDALRPDISADLFLSARNPDINPFFDIFQNGVVQDLKRNPPDLVGISMPTQGQFLAGITLASLMREAGLKCHITAGGPHISMLREQIPNVPALFDLFDSFVVFEGEIPLLKLVGALHGEGDLAQVPNLIYRQPGTQEIRANPHLPTGEVRQAQRGITPDFDGLPLERYLAPELVLPLITAHGCYFGKCAFCNVGYGDAFFSPFQAAEIVAQMRLMHEKYGCRHIFFVDEAIPPRTLRLLTELLDERNPIHWGGAVRFEKALTDDLLQKLPQSGCQMMLFGLESASEPIMERMIKGTRLEDMSRILRTNAAAGIWSHTFFFFGFPGETIENAQETVNFVYAHQDAIHSASPGAFLMEIYSPAYYFPEKFGVRRFYKDPKRDLAIYFDYEVESGMDEETAILLSDRFVEQLPGKRYGQYYVSDVYKFLYASELRRQGKLLPRWIE
jgi:anaerobic magnesium-protoporphyrin IX monomethyl ester cyclase